MSFTPPLPSAAARMSTNETETLSVIWSPPRNVAWPLPVVTIVLVLRSAPISVAASPSTYVAAFSASVSFTPSAVKSSVCVESSPIETAVSVCATLEVPLVRVTAAPALLSV